MRLLEVTIARMCSSCTYASYIYVIVTVMLDVYVLRASPIEVSVISCATLCSRFCDRGFFALFFSCFWLSLFLYFFSLSLSLLFLSLSLSLSASLLHLSHSIASEQRANAACRQGIIRLG